MNVKKNWFPIIITVLLLSSFACTVLSAETQTPDLQDTEAPPTIPTDTPPTDETPSVQDDSAYWVVMQDPGHGFRFAIPCFWEVDFPEDYTQGSGPSYPIRNYTDEFTLTFPRGVGTWENGAVKIDIGLINIKFYGFSPPISLRELAIFLYRNDRMEISRMEDAVINGQDALYVVIRNFEFESITELYLLQVSADIFLSFAVFPSEAWQDMDVRGILNSIALSDDVDVQVPTHVPGPPPIGLAAPCIPDYAEAIVPTPIISEKNTACGPSSFVSLEGLTDSIIQGLLNRNIGSLHYDHFINDPFMIGYWQSEGAERTPLEMANELSNALLPTDTSGLTFTTDRDEFPPLYGMPPENMFGPDVNVAEIIYSEGWGQDSSGAALLYIVQDECGGYYWHGMVVAGWHFDK